MLFYLLFFFFFFFFFKQKTAYEMRTCLEFRRVLFRSISFCDIALAFLQCLMGIPSGSEAVAVFGELLLVNRREYLSDGLLNHPIHYCRDTKQSFRSEERRVGKECRSRWCGNDARKKT